MLRAAAPAEQFGAEGCGGFSLNLDGEHPFFEQDTEVGE